jgi:hypothetical protein
LLVVAAHDYGARAARDVEDADRVWTAGDEIADEDESVAAREGDPAEQRVELGAAAMDVSDDDRATAHALRLWHASG